MISLIAENPISTDTNKCLKCNLSLYRTSFCIFKMKSYLVSCIYFDIFDWQVFNYLTVPISDCWLINFSLVKYIIKLSIFNHY